jgi:hypothetical protein
MKNFHRALIALATVLLLPGSVHAAACVTTSVASLIGTSCDISGQNYAFTDYGRGFFILGSFSGDGIAPELVTFTPDTSNAAAPGFSLSSPQFALHNNIQLETLEFSVTPSAGSQLSGFGVDLVGPTITNAPSTSEVSAGLSSASPPLFSRSALTFACNFVTGCSLGAGATGPVAVTPASNLLAMTLGISQVVSGDSNIGAVNVHFAQTPVPLPPALGLFAAGLVTLVRRRCRR